MRATGGRAVNLVNAENLSKAFGTRVLLDRVSLGVSAGERIGIVGRNGDGKSTLIRLLAGLEQPDAGRVTRTSGLRLGVLAQADVLDPAATIRSIVVGDRPEHEWASDAGVRGVLTHLLQGLDLDAPVGPLSGGERRRVALAGLLVDEPDLLVLDEPTNHLDVEGVDWLARHLRSRRFAVVVVTHDRWFLDAVVDTTWEVSDGGVHEYEGGYAAYVLARAERSRIAAADEARRQNLLRKELAWLRRGPPARTSKPQFRIDAANALIADEPPVRDAVELARFATARLGRQVLDAEDVTITAGPTTLLERVTWRLGPGDRVGIVGVNGSGKTTLLRVLAGERTPAAGRLRTGQTVRLRYLSQEVTELPPGLRVLEAAQEVRSSLVIGGRELTASQLLDLFGFRGERQWSVVGDLSGGERRRLQLLRLLMDEPNVLLLDEPTNDLDTETLTALEDLLDGWPGTLVVVSHDRYFVERVCDREVALLGDRRLRDLPGGVEQYLELRRAAEEERAVAGGSVTAAATGGGTDGAERRGDARAARKELTRIERRLERITASEGSLHDRMAQAAADFARVAELDAELRALTAEREELEERWLELAEVAG